VFGLRISPAGARASRARAVGFEQTEDVNHSRGAQTTFDRALDVAEREGWVAKMRPAQGLLEEDDLVEVAFEEGAIAAVDIRVRSNVLLRRW
jgi:hypothetical protein